MDNDDKSKANQTASTPAPRRWLRAWVIWGIMFVYTIFGVLFLLALDLIAINWPF